jgi:hypothetical protein
MSATSLAAAIGDGVFKLAAVATAWDLFRRDKLRMGASKATAEPDNAAPQEHAAAVLSGASLRAAGRDQREAAFAEARAAGKTVAEAGELAGIAARTARTYEARRLAAQNGGRA